MSTETNKEQVNLKENNDSQIDPKTYMGTLEPYFELVYNEYNHERNRKQSLESRSGIILSVIAAIIAIVFDKIKIVDIFPLFTSPITFLILLKIVTAFGIYIGLVCSVSFSLKTIFIQKYANYDVLTITPITLGNHKNKEMGNIILTYCRIIAEHRVLNEKKASSLSQSIIGLAICIISICLYINL